MSKLKQRVIKDSGYALFTSLVFLLILTTLGVVGMQSSTLEYRMGTNTAFHEQAFQSADGGRRATTTLLDHHIQARGWNGVDMPSGMGVREENGEAVMLFLPAASQTTAEDLQLVHGPTKDIQYEQDPLSSSIAVVEVATITNKGAGSAQLSGYQGLGKSLAVGGFANIYEVRSTGSAKGNATTTVASNYRLIPR